MIGGNGQMVLESEGRLTTYLVDPALEYRAFVHVSIQPMRYQHPTIRRDNRLLAVGSDTGVVLWDLARGIECAFLPIGRTWHIRFESSGDLLTSGATGMRRWPVRLDAGRSDFRIGPPSDLPFSRRSGEIDEDRHGRIIATARPTYAEILISGHLTRVGSLDDCRYVAVSPDGEWLATGSHQSGVQVWSVRDAQKEKEIPVDLGRWIAFSPDGKWLLTGKSTLQALDDRHLGPGSRTRRRGALLLPGRPDGRRPGREPDCTLGRGGNRPPDRSARKPRPVGRDLGNIQSGWFTPGTGPRKYSGRLCLGPPGDTQATRRDRSRLGRAGLFGR